MAEPPVTSFSGRATVFTPLNYGAVAYLATSMPGAAASSMPTLPTAPATRATGIASALM